MTEMTAWPDSFDQELFAQLREQRGVSWGRPVRFYESAPSTNDKALADIHSEAKTGIVYVAHQQTSGRGRQGNSWLVPAGRSLAFSVLVRLPGTDKDISGLSLAVGLALRDVVALRLPASLRTQVKWPNDVFVEGKKVAGILIESRPDPTHMLGVVIGVGLNALVESFPSELPWAGSLHQFGAQDLKRESLLVDCVGAIERRVGEFMTRGVRHIVTELREYDFLQGRDMLVDGEPCEGLGLNEKGQLLVRDSAGYERAITSAQIDLQ